MNETNAYWNEIMNDRMPIDDEMDRLKSILKGYYFDYQKWSHDVNESSPVSLVQFVKSKRPYGDENIPHSIAYQLGWDYQRRLKKAPLPEWVEEEAWKIHHLLQRELENNLSHS